MLQALANTDQNPPEGSCLGDSNMQPGPGATPVGSWLLKMVRRERQDYLSDTVDLSTWRGQKSTVGSPLGCHLFLWYLVE